MSSEPGSSFHAGPVELVPSLRGRDKAKYLDRTFTLESSSSHRYRWRCDQRQCKSRLITDFYGGDHMVYMFRGHDEDVHRLADSKQKSPLQMTYKQPPVKIGDYRYVLEKRIGCLQFWRCVHVSCSGRCRTNDGDLVSGPSEHQCSSLKEKPPPETDEQYGNVPGGDARVDVVESDIRDVAEDSSRDVATCEQQEEGQDEPQRKRLKQPLKDDEEGRQTPQRQQPYDRSCSPATNSELVNVSKNAINFVPWKPQSPASQRAALPDALTNYKNTECRSTMPPFRLGNPPYPFLNEFHKRAVMPEGKGNIYEDDRSPVANSSSSDEGADIGNAYKRESRERQDNKDSNNKADEESIRGNARGAEKDSARIRSFANEGHEKREKNMFGRFARGENEMTSTSRPGHSAAEWLQTPCSCSTSREKKLREDVLLQMYRLLEAETELVREMQSTEITLRGLLSRRVSSVPTAPTALTAPTIPTVPITFPVPTLPTMPKKRMRHTAHPGLSDP